MLSNSANITKGQAFAPAMRSSVNTNSQATPSPATTTAKPKVIPPHVRHKMKAAATAAASREGETGAKQADSPTAKTESGMSAQTTTTATKTTGTSKPVTCARCGDKLAIAQFGQEKAKCKECQKMAGYQDPSTEEDDFLVIDFEDVETDGGAEEGKNGHRMDACVISSDPKRCAMVSTGKASWLNE